MTNTDPDRVRDLALALAEDLADAQEIAREIADAQEIAREIARAERAAREIAISIAREIADAQEIARHLADAREIAPALDRIVTFALALARELADARELAHVLGRACDLTRELDGFLAGVGITASSSGQLRVPMRLAGRLTAIAAGLLPGAERARYREEFGSELAEIARAGGGRRAQLAYATRTVLTSAWQLRAALRSPRRRGAVQ